MNKEKKDIVSESKNFIKHILYSNEKADFDKSASK